ncbi:hypothetical protein AMTR_s00017p00063610 [Amborella trichopoda]|uniref:Uncharacterized protein n=1 Tax=Amborella trichopoda TaxID=13333 RepID=W1PL97_AMBTC|nr:hypothetical protein AMTR_s00017p00063610 [Amborella trichopoda]
MQALAVLFRSSLRSHSAPAMEDCTPTVTMCALRHTKNYALAVLLHSPIVHSSNEAFGATALRQWRTALQHSECTLRQS